MSDLVYSAAAERMVLGPLARWGYRQHLRGRGTPESAYRAMRKLYGAPTTVAFDRLAGQAAEEHPLLDLGPDPAGLVAGQVGSLVEGLRRDGFVRLDDRLPEAWCDELTAAASAAECDLVDAAGDATTARFDPSAPIAVRYEVSEFDVLASAAAQRVLADASLLALAQEYLGAAPILDLETMWWSAAVGRGASSAAAQQFHFDLDRLRFLKLFVYLTDVDERHGPHVYVRGSHRTKPTPLRRDGRHPDGEVESAFPGAVEAITGPRGSMFLADTLGLHKGLEVAEGHRLVFQIEWTSSLFGTAVTRPAIAEPIAELRAACAAHPWPYQRFGLA